MARRRTTSWPRRVVAVSRRTIRGPTAAPDLGGAAARGARGVATARDAVVAPALGAAGVFARDVGGATRGAGLRGAAPRGAAPGVVVVRGAVVLCGAPPRAVARGDGAFGDGALGEAAREAPGRGALLRGAPVAGAPLRGARCPRGAGEVEVCRGVVPPLATRFLPAPVRSPSPRAVSGRTARGRRAAVSRGVPAPARGPRGGVPDDVIAPPQG